MADQKVLLVDANSLANRAFYALPPLSTVNGVPTGAVYGFLTMLLKLIDETKPGYIPVSYTHLVFDSFGDLAVFDFVSKRDGEHELARRVGLTIPWFYEVVSVVN